MQRSGFDERVTRRWCAINVANGLCYLRSAPQAEMVGLVAVRPYALVDMPSTPVPWLGATFLNAFDSFARHRLPRLAATLAYYTLFSLAPLLLVALLIAGSINRNADVDTEVFIQLGRLVGTSMAETIQSLVNAQANIESVGGAAATTIGALVLFIGASGMFQALQDALNTVWDIPIENVRGLLRSLLRRLYGVVSVFIIGVLLSVFVLGAALVASLAQEIEDRLGGLGILVQVVNLAVAFLGVSVVTALVFQWLPARRVPWRAAWAGGVLTTMMLGLGSLAIAVVFTVSKFGDAFGDFAAIMVLLVYIYYTAQIFLLGAELTAAYVQERIEGTRSKT